MGWLLLALVMLVGGIVGFLVGTGIAVYMMNKQLDELRAELREFRVRERKLHAMLDFEQLGFRRLHKTLDKLVGKVHPARIVPIAMERNKQG